MKIEKLFQMAQAMDAKCQLISDFIEAYHNAGLVARKDKAINRLDTCKRASRRLWAAYIKELTKIKLEI